MTYTVTEIQSVQQSVTRAVHYKYLATLLLALFAQPQILGSSVFQGWPGGPGGEILLIHQTCDLELSSSLSHLHSLLSSKSELKTLFCILICHLLLVPTHHQ